MDRAFLEKLDDLRDAWGKPMIISSGYRCPKHNQLVSTTGPNGPHTTGHAADIVIERGAAIALLSLILDTGGFTGIGLNQKGPASGRFIHLDDLTEPPHPRPNIWTY